MTTNEKGIIAQASLASRRRAVKPFPGQERMMATAAVSEMPAAEGILPGHAITALHEQGVIQGPAFEPA